MNDEKFTNLVWNIFLLLGVILVIVAVLLFIKSKDYKEKPTTTATIKDIIHQENGEYVINKVILTYEIDGKKYESETHEYSSDFYTGKEIEIYFDEDNPYRVFVNMPFINLILLFGFLGMIFIFIGGFPILYGIIQKRQEIKIRKEGQLIYATYKKVWYNEHYSVNERHPYIVLCEWVNPVDGQKYLFKSGNMWKDPEYIINERGITSFPVYINPEKPKKYVVDITQIKTD